MHIWKCIRGKNKVENTREKLKMVKKKSDENLFTTAKIIIYKWFWFQYIIFFIWYWCNLFYMDCTSYTLLHVCTNHGYGTEVSNED